MRANRIRVSASDTARQEFFTRVFAQGGAAIEYAMGGNKQIVWLPDGTTKLAISGAQRDALYAIRESFTPTREKVGIREWAAAFDWSADPEWVKALTALPFS